MIGSRHIQRLASVCLRVLPSALLVVAVSLSLVLASSTARAASPHVDRVTIDSSINPISLHVLTQAISAAKSDGARALVLEIDTPGGDIASMNAMTKAELASDVPIISYVSPTGGRASSAGAFITLAAQFAAMAPTTRIGASSPVTGSGGEISPTLQQKIVSDLVASIRGIQEHYGRNADLAEDMVTKGTAYDDTTAVQENIVDLHAADLNSLLNAVDGRMVILHSGVVVTLHTAGVAVQSPAAAGLDSVALGLESSYGFLLDPNILFLLFVVGIMGLFLEVSHPGAVVPGAVGTLSLLFFLFASSVLALNWIGLTLMLLSFALLILDAKLPAHGVLTIGAVISLVAGASIFFGGSDAYGGQQIYPWLLYSMGALVGGVGFVLMTFVVRSQRRSVLNGVEGMVGATVVALTPLAPEGRVNYTGENWAAVLASPGQTVRAGTELQVVAVEGLRLRVRPLYAYNRVDVDFVANSD